MSLKAIHWSPSLIVTKIFPLSFTGDGIDDATCKMGRLYWIQGPIFDGGGDNK